jgi:hypothetical protein
VDDTCLNAVASFQPTQKDIREFHYDLLPVFQQRFMVASSKPTPPYQELIEIFGVQKVLVSEICQNPAYQQKCQQNVGMSIDLMGD